MLIIVTVIKSEKVSWIPFAQTHLSAQQIFGEMVKKMGSDWTHILIASTACVKAMPVCP